jgi:hypothetical protein
MNAWKNLLFSIQQESASARGAVVRFSAILNAEGNFSVVGFAEDSEQGKVFLMLGLESVRILRNA